MPIKKLKIFLIFFSLLTLIVIVFVFQKTTLIYKSKASDNLGGFKTQKLGTMLVPTDIPTVCDCNQCQVVIK